MPQGRRKRGLAVEGGAGLFFRESVRPPHGSEGVLNLQPVAVISSRDKLSGAGLPWELHAACAVWPEMSPAELRELADDIATHGLRDSITLILTDGALWGRAFVPWRKRRFRPRDPFGREWTPLPGYAEDAIAADPRRGGDDGRRRGHARSAAAQCGGGRASSCRRR